MIFHQGIFDISFYTSQSDIGSVVVFQALNKHNFAIVKYDSGKYTVIEI